MSVLDKILLRYKNNWPSLADVEDDCLQKKHSMLLVNDFSPTAAEESDIISLDTKIPIEMKNFWKKHSAARLFEDIAFGQWGLKIFSPKTAKTVSDEYYKFYKNETQNGDIVIGKFLGDTELLLLRCNPAKIDYGNIMVVLPLDQRVDWYTIGNGFNEFLEKFEHFNGKKYWEHSLSIV